MNLYRACGMTVACDRALPELAPARAGTPDWVVRTERPQPRRYRWFTHTSLPDGRRWMSIAEHDGDYALRFGNLTTFEIAPRQRLIRSMPARGTAASTVRHLLLDQVLPLVAGSHDRLALHASAVASPRGAIGFLGMAGRGKSTIAALLARAGWPLVCDDCLLVERRGGSLVTVPAYPGVRLLPDIVENLFAPAGRRYPRVAAYSPKRRVSPRQLPFARTAVPVARVYVLGASLRGGRQAVTIADRPRRHAMLDVIKHMLLLDVRSRTHAEQTFSLAGTLVERVSIRTLRCARDLSRLDEIKDRIMADVLAG